MIETPCIRLCRLDDVLGLCIGCGRSGEEIAGWATMAAERRREIMRVLPARLIRLSAPGPAKGD